MKGKKKKCLNGVEGERNINSLGERGESGEGGDGSAKATRGLTVEIWRLVRACGFDFDRFSAAESDTNILEMCHVGCDRCSIRCYKIADFVTSQKL